MTPQEQLDRANLQYAELADNYNYFKAKKEEIANLAKDYINASPEAQEKASSEMKQLVADYKKFQDAEKNILNDMYGKEAEIGILMDEIKNQKETQKTQPKSTKGRTATASLPEGYTEEYIAKYGLIGPQDEPVYVENVGVEYVPGAPENPASLTIPTKYSNELPIRKPELTQNHIDQLVTYNNNQPGTPQGTLAEGPKTTVGDYVAGMWNGLTDTYGNPQAWVYEKSSRQPGYNLGSKLGSALTVASLLYGANALNAPKAVAINPTTYPVSQTTTKAINMGSYQPAYKTTQTAASKFANGRTIPETANKAFWNYANGAGNNMSMMDVLNTYLK